MHANAHAETETKAKKISQPRDMFYSHWASDQNNSQKKRNNQRCCEVTISISIKEMKNQENNKNCALAFIFVVDMVNNDVD